MIILLKILITLGIMYLAETHFNAREKLRKQGREKPNKQGGDTTCSSSLSVYG